MPNRVCGHLSFNGLFRFASNSFFIQAVRHLDLVKAGSTSGVSLCTWEGLWISSDTSFSSSQTVSSHGLINVSNSTKWPDGAWTFSLNDHYATCFETDALSRCLGSINFFSNRGELVHSPDFSHVSKSCRGMHNGWWVHQNQGNLDPLFCLQHQ